MVATLESSASTTPNAATMAKKQRDISISEFFAKNRHLLGFDNPRKALLTSVKEAVDNSLDACEEARILPDITVQITQVEGRDDQYVLAVADNGPGIVKAQIPKVFGKLLYGSKFHRLRMSRGQQGIGISAAGMYGLITTGKPIAITSRPQPRKPAHYYELRIDTARNEPVVLVDQEVEWDYSPTGTRVEITMVAKYFKGRQSVDEYLEQTAIANPHASFHFIGPDGNRRDFPRATSELPAEPTEIQPHPHGIELGIFMRMLHDSPQRSLGLFLSQSFSRVNSATATAVCRRANIPASTVPSEIHPEVAEKLFRELQNTELPGPQTDCLVPIGVEQILAGMHKELGAEFYAAHTRKPAVYRGNPFLVEVGIAYGGRLDSEGLARVIRYANRVPLQYQLSACCSTKATLDVTWKSYNLSQSKGALPQGPLVILTHMASVWVPFTSESKEAIADYDEIRREFKLALQECGRKLASYLKRKQSAVNQAKRRHLFEAYIEEVVRAYQGITGKKPDPLREALLETARKKTELAEVLQQIKAATKAEDMEGTLIVDSEFHEDAETAGDSAVDGADSTAPVDGAEDASLDGATRADDSDDGLVGLADGKESADKPAANAVNGTAKGARAAAVPAKGAHANASDHHRLSAEKPRGNASLDLFAEDEA